MRTDRLKSVHSIFLVLLSIVLFRAEPLLSQTNVGLPSVNGKVYTIAVSGNIIYIGGFFTTVGGITRNNIAAIDATTLAVTSWNPNASSSGAKVYTIAVSGSDIYVGGEFTTIGAQTRNNIAKLNNTTGAADATWNPNANSFVNTIAINGTTVYAGGNFTNIGGASRNYIAALSSTSTGAASSWDPNANAMVRTLAYDAGVIFVGGDFTTIVSGSRNYIAMITEGGSLQTFNPNPSAKVYSIAVADNVIYIGGLFTYVGLDARSGLAAVNGAGTVLSWNPSHQSETTEFYAIAYSGSTIYAGGKYTTLVTNTRNNLSAINTSGTVTSWDPNIGVDGSLGDGVYSLALDFTKGRVYAGGQFTTVLGVSNSYLVGLTNTADGSLPVELSSFTVNVVHNNAALVWTTATEVNNYGFEIQRSPSPTPSQREGASQVPPSGGFREAWEAVGFVAGNGSSNSPKSYSYVDATAKGSVVYRLKQIDNDGQFEYSQEVEVMMSQIPQKLALMQNYPNPFNPVTTISFTLPVSGFTSLNIYDILGREVQTLVSELRQSGEHTVEFDAGNLPSGLYFYTLHSGNFVQTKKLMLLK